MMPKMHPRMSFEPVGASGAHAPTPGREGPIGALPPRVASTTGFVPEDLRTRQLRKKTH
jgi:hypothetical protein